MSQWNKNRILLVEDDADTQYAMAALVEMEGFEVITAHDGQEAYLKALTCRPDLIVTDINMPGVSGLDLISLLKQNERLARIPIIAMSAVEPHQLSRAMELGANAVYQKPIEYDKFISLIIQMLSAHNNRGRARERNSERKGDRYQPL